MSSERLLPVVQNHDDEFPPPSLQAYDSDDFGQVTNNSVAPLVRKPSLLKRTLAPMTKGSQRGATLNMVVSAVGAGMLSLPYVLKKCGLLLGLALLIISAVMAVVSLELLLAASLKTGFRSYSELTSNLIGPRAATALQACMVIYCFGAAVGYLIVINSCLNSVLTFAGIGFQNSKFNLALLAAMTVFPLKCLPSVSNLRYVSFVSVASMLYVMCAVVGSAVAGQAKLEGTKLALINWDVPSSMAIVIFSYASHVNLLPIVEGVQNVTFRRIQKVVRRSVLVELCLYTLIATSGYLSFHADTKDNVMLMYADSDGVMIAGRVAVIFSLCVISAMVLHPAHQDLNRLLFAKYSFSWIRHVAVSVVAVAGATVLATEIPQVSNVFGLLGATFSVLLCYALPVIFYTKAATKEECNSFRRSVLWCVLAGVAIVSALSIIGQVASLAGHPLSPAV